MQMKDLFSIFLENIYCNHAVIGQRFTEVHSDWSFSLVETTVFETQFKGFSQHVWIEVQEYGFSGIDMSILTLGSISFMKYRYN